jgi:hypothetical protein
LDIFALKELFFCLIYALLGGVSMPAGSTVSGRHLGETMRQDTWWLELVPVIVLLGTFGIYATLRAFEGTYYEWGPYLSPFYSPLIDPHHRWWPFSPALLILIWPLGFRVTCYYYRKAYYRAFFLDPPAWHSRPIVQRSPADDLCLVVPLAPPHGRRKARLLFLYTLWRPASYRVAVVELFE